MEHDKSTSKIQATTEPEARLDALGRRAGAAYRIEAPDVPVADFARRHQRQRNIRRGISAGAASALLVAGVLVFVNRQTPKSDDIGSVVTEAPGVVSAPTTLEAELAPTVAVIEPSPTLSTAPVPSSTAPSTLVPTVEPGTRWIADYTGATVGLADGEPVRVGWANAESADPLQTAGVRAAVEFANAELSGMGGHPIELVECPVTDDASASACGDTMAADDLLAVLSANISQEAFLGRLPADTPHLVSFQSSPLNLPAGPGVSFHFDGLTQFLAVIGYVTKALDPAPRSVALLTAGAATAASGAVPFAASAEVIPVEIGADMTSDEIVSAIGDAPGAAEAEAFLIYGINPGTCANLYEALTRVGTNSPVVGADLCFMEPETQQSLRRAGVTAPIPENWYMFSPGWDPTGENDLGYAAFVDAFGRHSRQPARAGVNSDNDGFAAVIALIRLVNELGGPDGATRATLQAAMTSFDGPMMTQFGPTSCGNVEPWGAVAPTACAGYIGVFHAVDGGWVAIANGTNGKLVGANGLVDVV